jgi:ABC-type ATPase involved in cell division
MFWPMLLMGGIFGYFVPSVYLSRRIAGRQVEHRAGFPDFMDLLVVCADAGLSMEAALDRVGLRPRARQRPGQLSGGHQQLVAIARAIAGRPPILLADEPTGNLDSASGDALMEMLSELHRGGVTVCLATHDARYIARANRHVYLFDGAVTDRPAS